MNDQVRRVKILAPEVVICQATQSTLSEFSENSLINIYIYIYILCVCCPCYLDKALQHNAETCSFIVRVVMATDFLKSIFLAGFDS